jgi:hypothetical protein
VTDSKRIAGLLGPTLVAVIITEALTNDIWTASIAPVLVYQAGMMWFVVALPSSGRTTVGRPVGPC